MFIASLIQIMRRDRMKRIAVAAAVACCLSACATVKESYAPDGRKAYALTCSYGGMAGGWDKCFAAAGNICGAAGYDVLDRRGEKTSMAYGSANSSLYGSFDGGSGVLYGSGSADYFSGSMMERSMLIACKVPPHGGLAASQPIISEADIATNTKLLYLRQHNPAAFNSVINTAARTYQAPGWQGRSNSERINAVLKEFEAKYGEIVVSQ
jgi:hypothetical protein